MHDPRHDHPPLLFRPVDATRTTRATRHQVEELLADAGDPSFRRFLSKLLAAQAAESARSQTQDAPTPQATARRAHALPFPGRQALERRLRVVS
jgi:hypothetical protein